MSQMSKIVRTRFAPSPTGYLHVGGLRTALYAYLFAKQQGGQFLLRIEDTDRERFVADGTLNILKSLYWAGIIPDEGVKLDQETFGIHESAIVQEGDCGSYVQSERLEIYQQYIKILLDKKAAYYCFCSSERLDALREVQQKNKLPTCYDRHCFSISREEAQKKVDAGERFVVRLLMPKEGNSTWNDLVRGEISFENKLIDDQVLIKSDGFPTYHFAVVVDDHLMRITHVIRGEEWISSTPKHLQLYAYFGWEAPEFAHLPLLLNPDKSKLSKRQGDVAVSDYEKKGYLSEALLNFVAFLGWNPGTEQEKFSLPELVKEFKLEKVNKSGAVFNLEKLDWYNKAYLKELGNKDIALRAAPWFSDAGIFEEDKSDVRARHELIVRAIGLEKERVTTLAELPVALGFVFSLPEYTKEMLVWKKSSWEELKAVLPEVRSFFEVFSTQEWSKDLLEEKTKEWIGVKKYTTGSVLWPLRVALSGQENSPGPFEIAEVLGKEETIQRLAMAVDKITE